MPAMFFRLQPIALGSYAAEASLCADQDRSGVDCCGIPVAIPSEASRTYLLSISCLRLTLTVTSGLTKSASSRDRGLCVRWSCALLRSSCPAGGFKGASLEFAVQNAGRSIFWRSLAAQEISAPAVRPNAPSSLPKNLPPRSSPPFRTVTGPFRSRASCAACSSASAHCWACCPKPPMLRY